MIIIVAAVSSFQIEAIFCKVQLQNIAEVNNFSKHIYCMPNHPQLLLPTYSHSIGVLFEFIQSMMIINIRVRLQNGGGVEKKSVGSLVSHPGEMWEIPQLREL